MKQEKRQSLENGKSLEIVGFCGSRARLKALTNRFQISWYCTVLYGAPNKFHKVCKLFLYLFVAFLPAALIFGAEMA